MLKILNVSIIENIKITLYSFIEITKCLKHTKLNDHVPRNFVELHLCFQGKQRL